MKVTPQTPFENLPQFLTVEKWRIFVRIGRSAAYDLIRRGIVPSVRFGRTVRIPKEGLLRFVSGDHRPETATPAGQTPAGIDGLSAGRRPDKGVRNHDHTTT